MPEEFDDKRSGVSDGHQPHDDDSILLLTGAKSPGVQRIEALSAHVRLIDRVSIFSGIFLIAYAC
jgi:MFS transporter, SIT family, siderophore-iron:H+ symporter